MNQYNYDHLYKPYKRFSTLRTVGPYLICVGFGAGIVLVAFYATQGAY
jgi:hypothetical protein